jgi:AP-1 complex subunit sigma 1/2
MDELFIGGYLQETSKSEVLRICAAMDEMMDDSKDEDKVQGRANSNSSPRRSSGR